MLLQCARLACVRICIISRLLISFRLDPSLFAWALGSDVQDDVKFRGDACGLWSVRGACRAHEARKARGARRTRGAHEVGGFCLDQRLFILTMLWAERSALPVGIANLWGQNSTQPFCLRSDPPTTCGGLATTLGAAPRGQLLIVCCGPSRSVRLLSPAFRLRPTPSSLFHNFSPSVHNFSCSDVFRPQFSLMKRAA